MKAKFTPSIKELFIKHFGLDYSNKLRDADFFLVDSKVYKSVDDRDKFKETYSGSFICDDEGRDLALAIRFNLKDGSQEFSPAHKEVEYFREMYEKEQKEREKKIQNDLRLANLECERLKSANEEARNELEKLAAVIKQKKQKIDELKGKEEKIDSNYQVKLQVLERIEKNFMLRFLIRLFSKGELE